MPLSRTSITVALVAVAFGIITLVAGARVLLGVDPGYIVLRPLLMFNTIMGAAYVLVGLLVWRNHRAALIAAAIVVILNLAALGAVVYVYATQGPVATTSIQAMAFRAAVWVVLLLALVVAARTRARAD